MAIYALIKMIKTSIESALYRLEGGWTGDFYEFFTEEFADEEFFTVFLSEELLAAE